MPDEEQLSRALGINLRSHLLVLIALPILVSASAISAVMIFPTQGRDLQVTGAIALGGLVVTVFISIIAARRIEASAVAASDTVAALATAQVLLADHGDDSGLQRYAGLQLEDSSSFGPMADALKHLRSSAFKLSGRPVPTDRRDVAEAATDDGDDTSSDGRWSIAKAIGRIPITNQTSNPPSDGDTVDDVVTEQGTVTADPALVANLGLDPTSVSPSLATLLGLEIEESKPDQNETVEVFADDDLHDAPDRSDVDAEASDDESVEVSAQHDAEDESVSLTPEELRQQLPQRSEATDSDPVERWSLNQPELTTPLASTIDTGLAGEAIPNAEAGRGDPALTSASAETDNRWLPNSAADLGTAWQPLLDPLPLPETGTTVNARSGVPGSSVPDRRPLTTESGLRRRKTDAAAPKQIPASESTTPRTGPPPHPTPGESPWPERPNVRRDPETDESRVDDSMGEPDDRSGNGHEDISADDRATPETRSSERIRAQLRQFYRSSHAEDVNQPDNVMEET